MKKILVGFFICMLMIIPVFSTTIASNPGPKLEIEISDWLKNTNPLIRYSHGVQIKNVGDETADGLAIDFWVTGGIFSKLRERLGIRDYWAYGGNKLEPNKDTYCPVHLNMFHLGHVELTAQVWAHNAEPVTKTVNAYASAIFIWILSEE